MIFIEYFELIPDPPKDINLKHELLNVVFLIIRWGISGCQG